MCKNQCCDADDYELIDVCGNRAVFRCKCGDKYLREGNRFFELLDDGTRRPYMRRSNVLSPWRRDISQAGAGAAGATIDSSRAGKVNGSNHA